MSDEAANRNMTVFELMNEKIKHQMPGESGLIALDWHNGNRSVLSDSNLTGCIFGLTLQTKHEDIYRAYLEATAFGTEDDYATVSRLAYGSRKGICMWRYT